MSICAECLECADMVLLLNIRRIFFIYLLILLSATSAWSDNLNPRDLRLIPEPRLSTFVFGNYQPDRQGTNEHYNQLFEGRSATEIVHFLEENGYYVFFPESSFLFFTVRKNVIFFDYSARVELEFNNGIFRSADVYGWGIK